MLVERVMKDFLENPPLFELSVDALMPSSDNGFPCPLMNVVKVSPWCIEIAWMATVSLVSNQSFITLKHVDNTIKSNLDITPLTTGERPIDPHYPSCLDTHSNLVPDSCSVELGRVPLLVEGPRLPDPEVRTIHRNLAPAAIVIDESILPFYLSQRCGSGSKSESSDSSLSRKRPVTTARSWLKIVSNRDR
jgi:hypothetical protein